MIQALLLVIAFLLLALFRAIIIITSLMSRLGGGHNGLWRVRARHSADSKGQNRKDVTKPIAMQGSVESSCKTSGLILSNNSQQILVRLLHILPGLPHMPQLKTNKNLYEKERTESRAHDRRRLPGSETFCRQHL